MQKFIDLITAEVVSAFQKAGYQEKYGKVSLSNRPDLCEYQCNGAMAAAKEYKKAPIMIAGDVIGFLKESEMFSMAEAVNPGFINLRVNPEYLASYMNQMQADKKLSVEEAKEPKTIVLDYGGPNVAKPLHVGHLRSAIIGESIKRMGRFLGHRMIGDVHLGDWGLQMGLIITELERDARNWFILIRIMRESIRRRRPLPSESWRRSIRQPAPAPKRMRRTRIRRWTPHISCSREEEVIWRSGIIS